MQVEYIDAAQLHYWIDTRKVKEDFLVVDVRDADFETGNIPNCLNVPANEFLLDPLKYDLSATDLVFHCAMSQIRGPKCAQRFASLSGRKVYILKGGFQVWQEMYKGNAKYVENHNQTYWDDPY
jgi:rhodanese-related sulfurtransferase